MNIQILLKQLDFSDKEIQIYLTLLGCGPASVRALAKESGVNRGTVYDILKSLRDRDLVSFYHKDKKQYFVAEDPEKLQDFINTQQKDLKQIKKQIQKEIPELKSLYAKGGTKPVARYYEGYSGAANILRDVLKTVRYLEVGGKDPKGYRTYSSANIREYIYKNFPDFTKQRIKLDISVRVIAMGEGGKETKLSERKWLCGKKDTPRSDLSGPRAVSPQTPLEAGLLTGQTSGESSPTYIIIYGSKTAFISLTDKSTRPSARPDAFRGRDKLVGVIIEDEGIAKTQKIIFDYIWKHL